MHINMNITIEQLLKAPYSVPADSLMLFPDNWKYLSTNKLMSLLLL